MRRKHGIGSLALLAALVTVAGVAIAEMNDKVFTVSCSGTATNTSSYVIHGNIESLLIGKTSGINPAAGTNVNITVRSDELLIHAETDITDGTNAYWPRIKGTGASGTVGAGTNYPAFAIPVSGPVTVALTNTHAGVTNTYEVKVIYSR